MSLPPCFHCGLPVPRSAGWTIRFGDEERPLCCAGCAAVARAIVESGLEEYYLRRTELEPGAPAPPPPELDRLKAWDHPSIRRGIVRRGERGSEISLLLENLRCAACVWLAERTLAATPGVRSVAVDFASRRADVEFDAVLAPPSALIAAFGRIGLVAHPFDPAKARDLLDRERRDRLLRFLVAGALGMQVMTLAVALYAGEASGMEPEFRSFFRWASLLLTAPVLLYSGWTFLAGAAADISRRRFGMDVPVALGLVVAFVGSVWATIGGAGEVYFDSVVMFIFLLHGARLLEDGARRRALSDLELLERPAPATAHRIVPGSRDALDELVATADLRAGDRIRIRPGETFPADGRVLAGRSIADEALLTGESMPVPKGPGDRVVGGAINVDSPLDVEVTDVGEATVLSSLERLVDRARSSKPAIARLADRVAARFSAAVVALALVVAALWGWIDPERVLPTVIAVLVVSCPCALSLATPLALAAANGALARRGLLITREGALEALARVEIVIFDKTGTLTAGKPCLVAAQPVEGVSRERLLGIAASLERGSEHPLARAVRDAFDGALEEVAGLENRPGRGVSGTIGGEACAAGSPDFIAGLVAGTLPAVLAAGIERGRTPIVVASGGRVIGLLELEDAPRAGASALVRRLARAGIVCEILSGDHPAAVARAGAALGCTRVEGGATPERKLERVRELTRSGRAVAMVGDGVNDAAALSSATVSIAIGGGAFLAASSSDAVLVSDRIEDLELAFRKARQTMRTIRGNFVRALVYNAIILPLAAAGLVPPWAAALGMTASSAVVVLNAIRLRRDPAAPEPAPPRAPRVAALARAEA